MPVVFLLDETNETHEPTSLIGEKASVLVFYRGVWCGYCTKHSAELNDIKADVETKGYQIFGITMD